MAGAYCKFCDHRCFVDRIIPAGPQRGWTGHLATCTRGKEHDRTQTGGYDATTAINPVTQPEQARVVRQIVAAETAAGRAVDEGKRTVELVLRGRIDQLQNDLDALREIDDTTAARNGTVAAEDAPIGVLLWPVRAPQYAPNFTLQSVAVIRTATGRRVEWTYENGATRTFDLGARATVHLPDDEEDDEVPAENDDDDGRWDDDDDPDAMESMYPRDREDGEGIHRPSYGA